MSRARRRWGDWVVAAALALGLAGTACGRSAPSGYMKARAAAVRAYAHGRYERAATEWQRAAELAESTSNRHEAAYRAAASLKRAERYRAAADAYDRIVQETPASARAARAAYDRADLELEHGEVTDGWKRLAKVVVDYPRSGTARSALKRTLLHVEEENGTAAAEAYLVDLAPRVDRTPLAEMVQYEIAKLLEQRGALEAALERYLAVTRRFPYPHGRFWDDALMRASLLEERLGRPERAVKHLRTMLAEREPSHIQGSYERPRFSEARYRIAELYRDALGDPERARREFRRLWTEHPTALLRDDAKWQEAVLAREAGDEKAACNAVETLARTIPDSRYVPCGPRVCPTTPPPADGRECRAYIVRKLESAATADPHP